MKSSIFIILILFLELNGCATHSVQKTGQESIILTLNSPSARNVQFLSSLDGFQPHGTLRNTFGSWEITLPSGQNFSYFYQIDGSIHVPDCKFKEFDDFGAQNCLYLP